MSALFIFSAQPVKEKPYQRTQNQDKHIMSSKILTTALIAVPVAIFVVAGSVAVYSEIKDALTGSSIKENEENGDSEGLFSALKIVDESEEFLLADNSKFNLFQSFHLPL